MIPNKQPRKASSSFRRLLFLTVLLWSQVVFGEQFNPIYVQRAEAEYHRTQAQFESATNPSPSAWQFARACYNLADFATNDDSRAKLANAGINACRKLILAEPKSGPAHYYLGMNMGQLARTELLGALGLVEQMEHEFKTAWDLDIKVDHAGPARSLGLLYRDAPGWPASIGSRHKAREWLDRAIRSDPAFPENLMVSTESYLQWDDYATAAKKLSQLIAVWPAAKTNFTGVEWEADWADWTARRSKVQTMIEEHATTPLPPVRKSG